MVCAICFFGAVGVLILSNYQSEMSHSPGNLGMILFCMVLLGRNKGFIPKIENGFLSILSITNSELILATIFLAANAYALFYA